MEKHGAAVRQKRGEIVSQLCVGRCRQGHHPPVQHVEEPQSAEPPDDDGVVIRSPGCTPATYSDGCQRASLSGTRFSVPSAVIVDDRTSWTSIDSPSAGKATGAVPSVPGRGTTSN